MKNGRRSVDSRKQIVGSRQMAIGNISPMFIAYCILPIAYFLTTVLLLATRCTAQPTVEFKSQIVGIGRPADNLIGNANHLDDFFESLSELKTKNDRKISILHIGDSHIQGDYLTQPTRKNLQQHFGNAGRGLIVPG